MSEDVDHDQCVSHDHWKEKRIHDLVIGHQNKGFEIHDVFEPGTELIEKHQIGESTVQLILYRRAR